MVLPVPNKLAFPPEYQDKSRLTYYASLFNSLEVNSSFYKVPMAKTTQRWAESVPDNFKFTFKLFKGITHNKGLAFEEADVQRFMQVIDGAGNKKGCLLIQFPGGTVLNLTQLEKLLTVVQKYDANNSWKLSVEFRHNTWYCADTYKLLAQYGACMVIHDIPKSATPKLPQWTDFVYMRFHGPTGDYRGSYTKAFLRKYAAMTNDWLKAGKTVYAYFNNTIGDALKNLVDMNSYVRESQGRLRK